MNFKVTTNNVPRELVRSWDLTDAERAEFDYYDWNQIEQGFDSDPIFVRYRGELVDLGQFTRSITTPGLNEWDGYQSDSYFSGLVVRYTDDYDAVVVGRYSS